MTSLNIGAVTSDRKPLALAVKTPCPKCGGKERVDAGGFGSSRETLCQGCGHEFKESE